MVTITVEMSADEYAEFCAKNPTLAPKVHGQNSRRRSRRTVREEGVQRAIAFLLEYLAGAPEGVHSFQLREWARTLCTPQIQPLELEEAKKRLGVYSTQWRNEKGYKRAKWHLPEVNKADGIRDSSTWPKYIYPDEHNEEDLI